MARNQPRKQVDTPGQSDCGQQASPRCSVRLSRRRCIQKHTKIARSGVDNLTGSPTSTAAYMDLALNRFKYFRLE
jgi:hypothetical protein